LRRFIVFHDLNHYPDIDNGEDRPTTLKMYDKENLLELFDELGILYNADIAYGLLTEEESALEGVNKCNGDGDDYFIVAEVIGDELKILVE